MSHKYILMDKDTIEPKGEVDGSLNAIVLHRKISGVLIAAVVVLGMFLISSKAETRKISMEAQVSLMSVTDSMQAIVDEANTEAEVTLLHAAIGKLSIMRGKPQLPSRDSIWNFIKSMEPWYPEYIMAQAIQETSCGINCRQPGSYNMFGMKVPSNRETTAINVGSKDTYARYKSWELGVIDRILWEIAVFGGKKPTEEQYREKLSMYGTADGYKEKITLIAKEYKDK